METRPKIALFQCQWCLYSEPDQYWVEHDLPSNIHLIKVPCTGRVNSLHILNAVQGGADGVMISGCLPEKCHFKEGNLSALRQHDEFSNFLDYIGYEKGRIRFVWLDLQDRGRIQRELITFEGDLSKLGETENFATRTKEFVRGQNV
jgi:F420-non-reducing hydrogenase iron-sulfur subunit